MIICNGAVSPASRIISEVPRLRLLVARAWPVSEGPGERQDSSNLHLLPSLTAGNGKPAAQGRESLAPVLDQP